MATLTSKLIVELIDRATAPSRAIAGAITRLSAAQGRNAAALANAQTQMIGAVGVAYALARSISAPVKAATAFETKLEDIGQKIEAPVAALPKLGVELRAVARDTTQTAAAIAEGMDVLAGMGASREDALGLLQPIGRAATAYNAEIADLSQAGFAALDNLKVPANEFGRALDAMAQAGKAGAFELKDMAKYFPQLGAGYQALKQTGVPAVADLSAALQIVRKGTGDSASAATNLSNILQKINSPLTRKNFAKMGVNLEKEMARAAKAGVTPIEAIAVLTDKVLKGNLGRLGDLFNDAQVQQGLRPLIQNLKEYRRIRKEALAAQGVVEEDYKRRLQTGAMATKRWQIAMESLNLAIGNALLPALTSLANDVIPIVNRMSNLAERFPALTRAIIATTAGLIALRVAGFAARFGLLWMWGGALGVAKGALLGFQGALKVATIAAWPLAASFRALRAATVGYLATAAILGHGGALRMAATSMLGLLNPIRMVTAALRLLKFAVIGTGIGAVLVGIATLGTWIYNNWSGIREMFAGIWEGLTSGVATVMPAIQPVVDGVTWLFDKFTSITGPLDASKESWRSLGVTIGQSLGGAITAVIDKIKSLFGWLTSIPGKIAGALGGVGSWLKTPVVSGGASPAVAGARAAGGPVRAGASYLVGERGTELFTPAVSGAIQSASATARMLRAAALASTLAAAPAAAHGGAGGTTMHVDVGGITVNAAPGQSPEDIAQAVERVLSDKLNALSRGAHSDGAY